MLSRWLLPALTVAYLGFLFATAFRDDPRSIYCNKQYLRPYIHGLALGVYCTSWALYGAVGTTVRDGWGYLPIFVATLICAAMARWYAGGGESGRVLGITGQPMADGGFVPTDIMELKPAEQALLEAKQQIEAGVEQRTRELSEALHAQHTAKIQAEAASMAKTRFVAAASHDLLQPLNAARLFASALEARAAGQPDLVDLASRIDGSMRVAEGLLKDLLDVARLDIGALRPDITTFPIAELLDDLHRQFVPVALSRRLRLEVVGCREAVRSDRVLLRRILQNYLSNALRYCERGRILIGCRRRGAELEINVYDTGPGIASYQREHLYLEFTRLEQESPWGEKGLGLGLSICDRLARLLNHELTLSSQPGHGSAFGVRVPRVAHALGRRQAATAAPEFAALNEYKVLVADNDPTILDAMQALLEQWGARVFRAHNSSEALWLAGCKDLDAVLVDYHLGEAIDGLELIQRIAEIRGSGCAAALLTADHGVELELAARQAGVRLLRKPLRPAALRALLSAFKLRSTRGSAA